MEKIKKLPSAEELQSEMSLTSAQAEKRKKHIDELKRILSGESEKKILCIGPCSADNEKAVLDYMERLAGLYEKVRDRFVVIPRIYTSKPRTKGIGYKGLLHRPEPGEKEDDLYSGIKAMRHMHLRVIQETELYGADEMLYPEALYYVSDLLSYAAVGARSVEDQQHRLVSSGYDIPVGMKNPTSGDIDIMVNAIATAQSRQAYIYHGWECHSEGNRYAHGILRGYQGSDGKSHPNYHYEDLRNVYDKFIKNNLDNPGVIIDCNHNNSGKQYDEQVRIAEEVFDNCKKNVAINRFVKGIMLESYICDGAQMIGEGVYGKSVTDPCLGWKKTEGLVLDLADKMI